MFVNGSTARMAFSLDWEIMTLISAIMDCFISILFYKRKWFLLSNKDTKSLYYHFPNEVT